LYVRGQRIDWGSLNRDYRFRHETLPNYPFQRKRYWLPLVDDDLRAVSYQARLSESALIDNKLDEVEKRQIKKQQSRVIDQQSKSAIEPVHTTYSIEWVFVEAVDSAVRKESQNWLWVGTLSNSLTQSFADHLIRLEQVEPSATEQAQLTLSGRVDRIVFSLSDTDSNSEIELADFIQLLDRLRGKYVGVPITLLYRRPVDFSADMRSEKLGGWLLACIVKAANTEWSQSFWQAAEIIDSNIPPASIAVQLLAAAKLSAFQITTTGVYAPQLKSVATSNSRRILNRVILVGGAGGVGLQLVKGLASAGCREIIVIARKSLQEACRNEDVAAVLGLEGVHYYQSDLTVREDFISTIAEIRKRFGEPDRVYHLAGSSGSLQPLDRVEKESIAELLRPKLWGAIYLHQALADLPNCEMVLVSSIASLWGAKFQGSYTIANGTLDAFARYRSHIGLKTQSINVGLWGTVGMADNPRLHEHLNRLGILPLNEQSAVGQMEVLLAAGNTQSVLCGLDEKVAVHYLSGAVGEFFFEALSKNSALDKPRNFLIELLQNVSRNKRATVLAEYLGECVADVLHMQGEKIDPDIGFADLGFDSLMAIDFKRELDVQVGEVLDTTMLFNYHTVNKLSTFLLGHFQLAGDGLSDGDGYYFTDKQIQEMDDSSAEGLLLKRLSELTE